MRCWPQASKKSVKTLLDRIRQTVNAARGMSAADLIAIQPNDRRLG